MADAPRLAMDVLQWSRHYRCFPGAGPVRPAALPRAGAGRRLHRTVVARDLQRRLPRGAEPPHGRRRDAVAALPARSRRACGWKARRTRQLAPRRRARAHACDRDRALRSAAGADALTGVAFLEFAVDEATEWLLDNVLETLGFRRAGRHRSKNVTLYRQGSINLILNAEPESFARAAFRRARTVDLRGRASRPTTACARSTARRRCIARASTAASVRNEQNDPRRARARRQPHLFRRRTSSASGALYEIDFDLTPPMPAGDRRTPA